MKITQFNEEVYYTSEEITKVSRQDIDFFKNRAMLNRRKRIRLCAHPDVQDALHEMLIVHVKGNYVRPHKHVQKSESFHIIEGRLEVVVFDEQGGIAEVIVMGEYESEYQFYYRLAKGYYHTVVPISDMVVFHEITNGPFSRQDTVFSPWSPAEDDIQGQGLYLKELMPKVKYAKRDCSA